MYVYDCIVLLYHALHYALACREQCRIFRYALCTDNSVLVARQKQRHSLTTSPMMSFHQRPIPPASIDGDGT